MEGSAFGAPLHRLQRLRPRVGGFDLLVRLGVLLDDDEQLVPLDDVLHRRRLVSREDCEMARVLPEPFVLGSLDR